MHPRKVFTKYISLVLTFLQLKKQISVKISSNSCWDLDSSMRLIQQIEMNTIRSSLLFNRNLFYLSLSGTSSNVHNP